MQIIKNIKALMKSEKGQGSLMSFFSLVMGLIMIAALLPVVNAIVSTIVGGNMSDLANADIIRLIVGMSGVILVLLFFMSIVSDFQTRQQFTS